MRHTSSGSCGLPSWACDLPSCCRGWSGRQATAGSAEAACEHGRAGALQFGRRPSTTGANWVCAEGGRVGNFINPHGGAGDKQERKGELMMMLQHSPQAKVAPGQVPLPQRAGGTPAQAGATPESKKRKENGNRMTGSTSSAKSRNGEDASADAERSF